MHKPDPSAQLHRTLLTQREIEYPHDVVVKMFDFTALEYLRLELWEVLKAALAPRIFNFQGTPATVNKIIHDLDRLIDALWLRLQYKQESEADVSDPADVPSDSNIQEDADYRLYLYPILNTYKGRVKRLTKAETEDPYLALKRVFNHRTPQEWKQLLADWTECALTPMRMISDRKESEFLVDYEYLEKLLEVAHLFNIETEDYDQEISSNADELVYEIDKDLMKTFNTFSHYFAAKRANRNIRTMLLEYLQTNNGEVPFSFHDFIHDLNWLMSLLDKIEDRNLYKRKP